MKYFKDVHLVLKESKCYDKGDGIRITLDTSEDKELDYDIRVDIVTDGIHSGYFYKISLKDLIYKVKDIIPYEWIADIKEDEKMTNKKFNKLRNMMLCILSMTDNENYARTHYILKKALEQFYDEREYEKELQSHGYSSFTEFINDLLTRC